MIFNFGNSVLLEVKEIDNAIAKLETLGLPPHFDRAKSWDLIKFLKVILQFVNPEQPILDCGCMWSPLLPYLYYLGYQNLHGIDLLLSKSEILKQRLFFATLKYEYISKIRSFSINPTKNLKDLFLCTPKFIIDFFRLKRVIFFSEGDITSLPFNDESFQAISCISVIEHGVDINKFISEAYRTLRRKGLIFISTDYWCEKIDIDPLLFGNEKFPFTKVYTPEIIKKEIIGTMKSFGFEILSDVNLECKDKIIRWKNLEYTFFAILGIKN